MQKFDDGICKQFTNREANRLLSKAELCQEMTDALAMVLKRWSFGNDQQHTHTWHDMQDCRNVILPLISKAFKIQASTR